MEGIEEQVGSRKKIPIKPAVREMINRLRADFKDQILILSNGDQVQYEKLMNGSVEDYLRKFEHSCNEIKSIQENGRRNGNKNH